MVVVERSFFVFVGAAKVCNFDKGALVSVCTEGFLSSEQGRQMRAPRHRAELFSVRLKHSCYPAAPVVPKITMFCSEILRTY